MNIIEYVRKLPRKAFNKGEILLSEGDRADSIFAISTGFVKVTALDDDGNERLLWIAGRYDIVPTELFFSKSRPLRFFYTALSDGLAYCIDKRTLLDEAKSDLTMMTEIATSLSTHYDDLMERLNSIEKSSVSNKLLSTLRYLAERFDAEPSVDLYQLGLRLTHQDLADMVGSTRETTSVELDKLRTAGYIDYDNSKFVVHTTHMADTL
ncbi:MAG: Crp/Fnr family transcriptional regulator [Candidatus Saccharimonadales bacterium]